MIAAAVAGGLHVLALPPWDASILAWVALAPLIAAIRQAPSLGEALRVGVVFGVVSTVGVIHWLPEALVRGNDVGSGFAFAVSLLVVGYFTVLFCGFAGATWALGSRRGWTLAVATSWLAMETLRAAGVPALDWLSLGHTQHAVARVRLVAAVVGPGGLALWIVLANAWVVGLWEAAARTDRPAMRRAFAAFAACGLAAVSLGGWQEHRLEVSGGRLPSVPVGAVQLALSQSERWIEGEALARVGRLLALSHRAAEAGARLIVWPETAIEMHLDELDGAGGLASAVTEHFAEGRAPTLLVGAPRAEVDRDAERFYNSAALIDAGGRVRAVYDKSFLYPLTEYVPAWIAGLPGADRALAAQLRWEPYTAGEEPAPLVWDGLRIGPLICAEALSTAWARHQVEAGANVLAQLANDAVIPSEAAAAQHFAIVRMLAAAMQRPLIRASNLGRTAVIAADGSVLASEPGDRPGFVQARVAPRTESSAYARIGFRLEWASVAIVAGVLAWPAVYRRGRKGKWTSADEPVG